VPLLSDEDLSVAKLYGVVGFAGPVGKLVGLSTKGGSYIQRAIFVVNGDLVIRYRQVSRTGATFQDVDDLAEAAAALS
jgi:peroxiredoxin